ncbi:uncharacterized protein STEHIDRAFT_164033 [Stereum hirsutum FP-91666 SS1]|uniref:Uncharacterized protein n=1 Tax=Stereum hirsutum (strain FP-91666) TaxID=721885 RepID=R7RXI7_STEHR|nr:uncharacterized protein STEHIDRAFT_164033 [Stereum hirsutum FP-91666 SS1]EIM79082.1 hypothetical protein STEHIDRAFT_164033 [Stereum hirsutum FP-91666 SS1]
MNGANGGYVFYGEGVEVGLSNVGGDVHDGRLDPRANRRLRWRKIECPAKTVKSPKRYGEREGKKSSSEVEKRVKGAKSEATSKERSKRMLLSPALTLSSTSDDDSSSSTTSFALGLSIVVAGRTTLRHRRSRVPRIKTVIVDDVANIGQHDFHTLTTASPGAAPFLPRLL